jgi:hypothetical protein
MPWYVRATRAFLSSEGERSLTNVIIRCDRIQEFSDKRGLDYEDMYGYPIKTGVILIQEDGEPWSDVVHNFLCLETEEVIKASRFWKDDE